MKLRSVIAILMLAPMMSVADICSTVASIDTNPYATDIGTRKVTFLAVDLVKNNCWAINKAGLSQRHPPYSTFKIPHSLIALEAGAVKSIDERIEWDQIKYPAQPFWPETWKKSHTLASAFKHSAVWYYKALVPRITPAEYKRWLARFHYGNQTFTARSNEFWLNGELQISPAEQVEFIACLLKNRCGVKTTNFAAFEPTALQDVRNGLSLYAKTGAGPVDPQNFDGAFEGWYVGYVKAEDGKPVAAFALYMEAESFSQIKTYRKDFSLRLLTDLNLWNSH
jgi:beta-lactamase class D